jgi:Uma2 family endonuclease
MDRRGAVREKVADWLRGGARLVWVIDPIRHRAVVHRADASETILAEPDVLDGEDVLPGFTCQLADLLAP